MTQSYTSITNALTQFAANHLSVRRFKCSFFEQLDNFSTSGNTFPLLYAVPNDTQFQPNVDVYSFRLYCIDVMQKDRSNESEILNDTLTVLRDLRNWLYLDYNTDLDLISDPRAIPVNNFGVDYTVGWMMDIEIQGTAISTECAIPFSSNFNLTGVTCDGGYIGRFLTCDTLESCAVILNIEDRLTALEALTGTTNDTYVTGGTYISSASTLTLRRNDNVSIPISGFSATAATPTLSQVLIAGNNTGNSNIMMDANSIIESNGGPGMFSLSSGGVPQSIVLDNDGSFTSSVLSFDKNLYGFTNIIALYANDLADNTELADITVGVYSRDALVYRSYMNVSSTKAKLAFGNDSLNIDGNGIVLTSAQSTISNDLNLASNTPNTLAYHDSSKNIKSVLLGSNLSLVGGVLSVTGTSGSNTYVTGGTYNNSIGTATFTNNTGGTFTVTGFNTGSTSGPEIFITGGTPNNSAKTYTFTNNTGGTFNLIALTDIRVTGGTYSNGTTVFTNNTGGTFSVSGYFTGSTDVYGTAFTYSNNTFTITNSTGGTMNATINTMTGLTINGSLSATTYLGLPVEVFVTGGTYSASNRSILFTNNTGGTFNVTGITGVFVTGGTLAASGTATFTNNTGGTFTVAGFKTTDFKVTGATTNNAAKTYTFINNTGGTFTVTGLTDIAVTSFTYSNNNVTLTNTTGGTMNAIINTFTGLSVTGAFSANTISSISLSGSTDRMVEANSGGTISASKIIISAYIASGSTAASALTTTSNWSPVGAYTGSTITGTSQGQKYYNASYYFEAVQDNLWIRLIRG